jgi:hypothetical protein
LGFPTGWSFTTHHPASYAKVRVDEIVPGFHDMELNIDGLEDERTLGEVLGGVIL